MKKVFCIVFAALSCISTKISAQGKLDISNVYKVELKNQGAIITNSEVKGYFLFYISDKIDKKTYEYTLQILDENLNKVKDIRFEDSKKLSLLEASFNGINLMFEFFDGEEKSLVFRSYDFTGKQVAAYYRELDKKSFRFYAEQSSQSKEDTQNRTLFPVEGKGFISLIPVRDEGKDYAYEVNYYRSDTKSQWTFNPESDDKFEQAQFLGTNDSVAVMQVTHKKSLLGGKYESWLVGLSLINGKQIFAFETENKDKYNFMPMNVATIAGENGFVLSGPYYNAGDNVVKDKSIGLGIWVMDNKGNIVKAKYDTWNTELSKFMDVKGNGKVDDLGYLFIHKIIRTSDDKIFAIAEGYKKQANAAGIAANVLVTGLGGRPGFSNIKLRITDIVVLEFDKDFDLKRATTYDKGDNSVAMESGMEFMGPQTLAMLAKYVYDAFDYSYTQIPADRSGFVVGYNDYVKEDGYKGGTFNTISYDAGKFTTDKINLNTSASSLLVLPGKTGSVVILEYFKKEKKLSMRMEKMN